MKFYQIVNRLSSETMAWVLIAENYKKLKKLSLNCDWNQIATLCSICQPRKS